MFTQWNINQLFKKNEIHRQMDGARKKKSSNNKEDKAPGD